MWKVCSLFLILATLTGCGGGPNDEPERFHLSGEVKYNGQLVGDGMVYFEPTQGNTGAAGFAILKAGRYDSATEGGKGHVGGKMIIRMTPGLAPDAVILDDNAPVPATFPLWEEVVDLPKEASTMNFDIPKDAEKLLEKKQISDQA